MTDAFINYSRTDEELASRIAATLDSQGLSVWWDRKLPVGLNFVEELERALAGASCIITVWSPQSIRSEFVQAEAQFAMRANKLLPIAIGGNDLPIPLAFKSIQTDFVQTSELFGDEWLERLVRSVRDFKRRDHRPIIDEAVAPEMIDKARHVEEESSSRRTVGGTTPRTSPAAGVDRKKAFISYAEEDEPLAIDLVKYLETAGCPCWISFRDVDPGEDYRLSITKAMNEVALLVLVYSHHVNTSFDIATELLLARKRQRRRFVLRTDDTEPAGPVEYELATVQWVDCRSNHQAAFERIAQRSALLA